LHSIYVGAGENLFKERTAIYGVYLFISMVRFDGRF
jgi:hypothetical protein